MCASEQDEVRQADRPLSATTPGENLRARVAFSVLYVAGTLLSFLSILANHAPGPVWPGYGVVLVWLLRTVGWQRARWADLAWVAAVSTVLMLFLGAPVVDVLVLIPALLVGPAAAVLHLERDPEVLGVRRPSDLLHLLLASLLGGAASAGVAAAISAVTEEPLGTVDAAAWLVRSSVSMFLIAALGLRMRRPAGDAPTAARSGWAESTSIWVTGAVGLVLVLLPTAPPPVSYLLVPGALWAGLRLSARACSAYLGALFVAVIAATVIGRGPFGSLDSAAPGVQESFIADAVAQGFVSVLVLVALVVACSREVLALEQARTVAALAESTSKGRLLRGVLDGATHQGIVAMDLDGRIELFSSGAQEMLGWTSHEAVGTPGAQLVPNAPTDLGRRVGASDTYRVPLRRRDGSTFLAEVTSSAMLDLGGARRGAIRVFSDVTAQVAAERAVADSEAQFRSVFQAAPTGLATLALAGEDVGRILRTNASFAAFTGRDQDELIGVVFADLVHGDDVASLRQAVDRLVSGGPQDPARIDYRVVRPDGQTRWGCVTVTAARPTDGSPPHLVAVVEDVTARRDAEDLLRRMALHDPLTGLPNRTLLADRLERALTADRRLKQGVTMIYGDLDGFKAVNDTHGHAAGDQLLREVAGRLEGSVRIGDTVARLGGDEFAVLCPGLQAAQVPIVLDRMSASLARPIELLGGYVVHVGLSTGAATAVGGGDPDRLIGDADRAMYEVKRQRRRPSATAPTSEPSPSAPQAGHIAV